MAGGVTSYVSLYPYLCITLVVGERFVVMKISLLLCFHQKLFGE